jgi:hypothetical protein
MLKRHLTGLLSYFRQRVTNAVSEGFNSRIQSIKPAARGFRAFANYRARFSSISANRRWKTRSTTATVQPLSTRPGEDSDADPARERRPVCRSVPVVAALPRVAATKEDADPSRHFFQATRSTSRATSAVSSKSSRHDSSVICSGARSSRRLSIQRTSARSQGPGRWAASPWARLRHPGCSWCRPARDHEIAFGRASLSPGMMIISHRTTVRFVSWHPHQAWSW